MLTTNQNYITYSQTYERSGNPIKNTISEDVYYRLQSDMMKYANRN